MNFFLASSIFLTSCLPSNFLEIPSFNFSETSCGFDDNDDDLSLSGFVFDVFDSTPSSFFSSESRQS